jgi:hypothetical protein
MNGLPSEVEEAMDLQLGQALVELGAQIRDETAESLGVSFPPASREGEFAHARTRTLQKGVVLEPTDPDQAAADGCVRVGYSEEASYGGILELSKQRLGIAAVAEKVISEFKPSN